MTYAETIQYIESVPRFVPDASLENTKNILHLLGDPDRSMMIFHIAGTNGKGSVCSYIDSMLREYGCRTGLFTSPHLVKMNERFMIDGEPVSDEIFLYAFERVKEVWEKNELPHPSYFEILFLMSMVIFPELGVEAAVLETGMGGRLDATNAVHTAKACVITSISFDHMAVLGNTIEEIALQKAGIMKKDVPCFYIDTNEKVSKVLREYAKKSGFEAIPVEPGYGADVIRITSRGKYQKENAALALYAMRHLKDFKIPDEILLSGLSKSVWPGRMEEALPGVFLDGAHNEDGIRRFVESAAVIVGETGESAGAEKTEKTGETAGTEKAEKPGEGAHAENTVNAAKENTGAGKCVLLFSAVRDKEYKKMAAELAHGLKPRTVITTEVSTERAAAAEDLAAVFREAGCENVYPVKNVKDAFERAREEQKSDILFCVGSLYLIGELKKVLRSLK